MLQDQDELLFQDQDRFFKRPSKLLIQDLKKRFLTEKNQASYAGFAQSCCRYYAGDRKNCFYRLSC